MRSVMIWLSLPFTIHSFIGGFLPGMTGRFEIAIGVAGVVVGVGERIAMIKEVFHRLDRNGKTKPFPEGNFHVCDADDLARKVEERAAAVAGIDLRGGLQIKSAAQLAGLGAENALRHSALKAERTAYGEDVFTHRQR